MRNHCFIIAIEIYLYNVNPVILRVLDYSICILITCFFYVCKIMEREAFQNVIKFNCLRIIYILVFNQASYAVRVIPQVIYAVRLKLLFCYLSFYYLSFKVERCVFFHKCLKSGHIIAIIVQAKDIIGIKLIHWSACSLDNGLNRNLIPQDARCIFIIHLIAVFFC